MPKSILLDWDDTLAHTRSSVVGAMEYILKKYNKEPWDITKVKYRDTKKSLKENFINFFGENANIAYEEYLKYYIEYTYNKVRPMEKAIDFYRICAIIYVYIAELEVQLMPNVDEIRAKMPCPLHKMFCIINQIQTDCVEPWYGQIKQLADGADKWNSGMHKAVIFGMYPELEKASKEWFSKYKDIYNEFEENPNKDRGVLSNSLEKLSLQIGEQYGLNENRYLFNKMTEEQAKRVQERKEIEIKKMCQESAEALIDPLHIVVQGMIEKLTPKDYKMLMGDFHRAEKAFEIFENNDQEQIDICKNFFPEACLIYKQVKKSLEVAEIKDCYQRIDHKNYKQFAQTLGNFKYKGKEYNLLDVVRPITQKRDAFGRTTEVRVNTFSPLQPNKRVLGG